MNTRVHRSMRGHVHDICVGVCMDMCMDEVWMDMCLNTCVAMRTDTCASTSAWTCAWACASTSAWICARTCAWACARTRAWTCTDITHARTLARSHAHLFPCGLCTRVVERPLSLADGLLHFADMCLDYIELVALRVHERLQISHQLLPRTGLTTLTCVRRPNHFNMRISSCRGCGESG